MKSIYLDANILFLAFEQPRAEGRNVWRVFDALEATEYSAVTSEITLSEVLPKPLSLGQSDLVELYEDLFRRPSIFELVPVGFEILAMAARIRGERLAIQLPDAVHLATAHLSRCSAFFTADKRLASYTALRIIFPGPACVSELRALAS